MQFWFHSVGGLGVERVTYPSYLLFGSYYLGSLEVRQFTGNNIWTAPSSIEVALQVALFYRFYAFMLAFTPLCFAPHSTLLTVVTMSEQNQTPTSGPIAAGVPAANHLQTDFESTIHSYVAVTDPAQVARIKDFMVTTLQAECDKQDTVIKAAREDIDRAMKTFNANREKLLEIMRREEGLRRTEKAAELGGLDKMVPPTFKKLVDEFATAGNRERDPMSPDSLQTPSVGPVDNPQPPKRARTETNEYDQSTADPAFGAIANKNLVVHANDVAGKEFIFPYPKISKSYYVLRCDGNKEVPAQIFKTHPFESRAGGLPPPALEHFKEYKRCKGNHDGGKEYRDEDIVRRWGHRVEGQKLKNEGWVDAANGRLRKSESRKASTPDNIPTGPRVWARRMLFRIVRVCYCYSLNLNHLGAIEGQEHGMPDPDKDQKRE
ncbi:hypothetical protein V8F20_009815 [Naviculisporaceae sp. PSN 640]